MLSIEGALRMARIDPSEDRVRRITDKLDRCLEVEGFARNSEYLVSELALFLHDDNENESGGEVETTKRAQCRVHWNMERTVDRTASQEYLSCLTISAIRNARTGEHLGLELHVGKPTLYRACQARRQGELENLARSLG
jgi:hypothetical protein